MKRKSSNVIYHKNKLEEEKKSYDFINAEKSIYKVQNLFMAKASS